MTGKLSSVLYLGYCDIGLLVNTMKLYSFVYRIDSVRPLWMSYRYSEIQTNEWDSIPTYFCLPTTYRPPTDHQLTTNRPPTDHLPTTYWLPTDHLLTTYQPPTDHLPTTYWPLTNHLLTTYRPLTDHLPTTYPPLTHHLLTIYWPPTDHFFYGAACSRLSLCGFFRAACHILLSPIS